MTFLILLFLVGTCLARVIMGDVLDPSNYDAADVIITDVAIIGGGAAGTYAAINLQKMGQKVVLVEKNKRLGGHTNTYTDHSTKVTVDYGAQAFLNSTVSLNYFAHLGVPVTNYLPPRLSFQEADFNTGQPVIFNASRDISGWAAQLAKYAWLDSTWNVPQPVDADLLLPLGEFIKKYNLSNIAFFLYFSAQGMSNPLQQPTVNVMKMVDPAYLHEISGGSLVTTKNKNSEIYIKALAKLGDSVLTLSTVTAAKRPNNGPVSLAVKTRAGSKLIRASKLLITIPPTLELMRPFGLSAAESVLFSCWNYMGYCTLLLNNTGLPSGVQWINANNSAATYHIPQQPSAAQITSTAIPGVVYVWYRSPTDMKQKHVEKATIEAIQKLQRAQNLPLTTPHILKFKSHTPYKLSVSAESINDGFYSSLYALQGQRNTWYTGAAFIAQNSGLIWNFTQGLLPQIVST